MTNRLTGIFCALLGLFACQTNAEPSILFSAPAPSSLSSLNWLTGAQNDPIERIVAQIALTDWNNRSQNLCLETNEIAYCLAPDTSYEDMLDLLERLPQQPLGYVASDRWSQTATNGSNTGSQGGPITLTYSFVPDGISIPGDSEPTSPNILNARFNQLFGSTTLWKQKFRQAFQRWSQLTGIKYVEEANDDGAAFPNSPGVLGVRGDLRIAGHNIDGNSNVLAYTFFPNIGDMVYDTSEGWGASSGDYIFLRNVTMHEHGHGIGMEHVWPINGTKLMEPLYSDSYDGPQDDDIRGGQRNYGDSLENNDTFQTATDLGALSTTSTSRSNLSTDSSGDLDWYKFTATASARLTVTVTPIGSTYNVGASSGSTSSVSTHQVNDLQIQVYSSNGTTLLIAQNTAAAGAVETLTNYQLPNISGTYFVKVSNGAATPQNNVQRYNLSLSLSNLPQAVIIEPSNNEKVRGTVSLEGAFENYSGSTVYFWRIDGSPIATGNSMTPSNLWDSTTVADGTHTLTLAAQTINSSITIQVDNSGPAITLNSPQDNLYTRTNFTVNATLNDPIFLSWTLRIDGQPRYTGASTTINQLVNIVTLSQGAHTLVIEAEDTLGNVSARTINFVIDRTAPAPSITSPATGAFVKKPVQIQGAIVDANPGAWTLIADGGTLATGTGDTVSYSWTNPSEGAHTLTLQASDKVPNTATSASVTFTVDSIAPAVTINSPAANATVSGSVPISATITDVNLNTWRVLVDGTQIATGSGGNVSATWNAPGDGQSHTIQVEATDKAGNVSSAQVSVTTPSPNVTFTGTVNLQSYVGSAKPISGLPLTVTVNGTPRSASLSGSGNTATFTLTLPASSSQTIRVKVPGYLGVTQTVNLGASNSGATFSMSGGDVNNDNTVDDFDLFTLTQDFLSSTTGPSDLNGDGTVDDFDLFALTSNFLQSGS